MTLGIFSNIVALVILANAYSSQRRRSKATFLLFATSLVVTDFIGHVIPGALVLRLYLSGGVYPEDLNSSDGMCQFLGGSMVFFGLCPLFMGCAMAAERCLGVTKPLLHSSLVTTTRSKICLSVIWMAALCVALLPCFQLGSYTYQDPGTWCFIKIFGLMSVILSYTGSIGKDLSNYRILLVMGVRLATWNQILDPWVYILLRRTILRKIYLISKCQLSLRANILGRWEPTSYPSSEKNEVKQI
ncbi:unnamed protein product [Lampetra planeri]